MVELVEGDLYVCRCEINENRAYYMYHQPMHVMWCLCGADRHFPYGIGIGKELHTASIVPILSLTANLRSIHFPRTVPELNPRNVGTGIHIVLALSTIALAPCIALTKLVYMCLQAHALLAELTVVHVDCWMP